MKLSTQSTFSAAGLLFLASSFLPTVSAHGYVQDISFSKSGKSDEWYTGSLPFTDSWKNPIPSRIVWPFYESGNGPVTDVSLNDIACNKLSAISSSSQLASAGGLVGGEQVTFHWTKWPIGHQGPIMTYLARCVDSSGNNVQCDSSIDPTSLSYFKIDEAGYDKAAQQWASDKLVANNNSWTVTLPDDIAPGYYIVRHEILSLHEGMLENGAQFYPMCANIQIQSTNGNKQPEGVKFPGAYKSTDPSILINIYDSPRVKENYVIPGPALYSSGSGSTGSSPKAETSSVASLVASAEASTSPFSFSQTTFLTQVSPSVKPAESSTLSEVPDTPVTTTSESVVSTSTTTPATSNAEAPVLTTSLLTTKVSSAPVTSDAVTDEKTSTTVIVTSTSASTSQVSEVSSITVSPTRTHSHAIHPAESNTVSNSEPASDSASPSVASPSSESSTSAPTPTNSVESEKPTEAVSSSSSSSPSPSPTPASTQKDSTPSPTPASAPSSDPAPTTTRVSTPGTDSNQESGKETSLDPSLHYEYAVVTASPVYAKVTKTIYETSVVTARV